MAGGGKETPRQKMVGMMYLVLTALLALQVSNSVLEKFEFIRQSLDNSTTIAQKSTQGAVDGIQAKVDKDKNEKDMAVLEKAKKVKTLTAEMMGYMAQFDTDIINASGGWVDGKEGGELAGAKDYDMQMAWSLGKDGAKNGKAYELKEKLDAYVDGINGLVDSLDAKKFAKSGKELYPNDENQNTKDFAYLNFDHTPTVACRAIIAQFKSEIASVETKAVERLAQEIGATKLKFDKVFAVALPNSRVVASGTKYSAELFIAASSNSVIPRMTAGGSSLKVDAESGRGLYEVTARTSKAREKRSWKGTISIPNPSGGGDTTFTVEEEYEVVAPVIQVQSAAVAALYLNCGNDLNVQVPALGDAYSPSFSASGAKTIKGATRGDRKSVV